MPSTQLIAHLVYPLRTCLNPVLEKRFSVVILSLMLGLAKAVFGAEQTNATQLADLSLEALGNIEVTSVSKKTEKLFEAPAAVYVVTSEDIRRTGAQSVAEALRIVPGMDVARVNSHRWAISSRGFNSAFANKLLVLVDGRSVYSPMFAGVHWDTVDLMLEDVERIEVVRGPGATLWGANAVNGVINIISKSAKATQGGLVTAGSGSDTLGFGSARYGGKISDSAYYRVYGKYQDHDAFEDQSGNATGDQWHLFKGGFRIDWDIADGSLLTFQGDYYRGHASSLFPTNNFDFSQSDIWSERLSGGDVLTRWTRILSEKSEVQLQAYYDRVGREARLNTEIIDTFDVQGQHRLGLGERNEIISGVGYRLNSDHDLGGSFATFNPSSANRQIFSAFAQDELTLVPDKLRFTFGSKFEHNDYCGFEIEPSGRLSWTATERQTLWGAVSRAVRTPSRYESDISAPLGLQRGFVTTMVNFSGNSTLDCEKLSAYELGYRVQPSRKLSFDLAGFYNDYEDLIGAETGASQLSVSSSGVAVTVPTKFANNLRGHTYGAELSASWKVTDIWKLSGGYSWLKMEIEGFDANDELIIEGSSPQNQFNLRSYLDLPWHLQFDSALYFVDRLAYADIPDYVRMDLRLGWQPIPSLEFSLVGQNLLQDHHRELGTSFGVYVSEVPRTVYGKVTWRF